MKLVKKDGFKSIKVFWYFIPSKGSMATLALLLMVGSFAFFTTTYKGQKHPDGLEPSSQMDTQKLQASYLKLPLSFEANQGQTNKRVKFLSRGSGYSLFLTPEEVVLSIGKPVPSRAPKSNDNALMGEKGLVPEKIETHSVHLKLVGANQSPTIKGLGKNKGISNYFLGSDPKKWRTNVPHYSKVLYEKVYPGIDLIFYGNQQRLEYDFVVDPGANPEKITLKFEGAEKLEIDAKGDLILHTSYGEIRQLKPVIYQEIKGIKHPISGGYVLKGKNQVSFHLANYDAKKPLIIDPVLFYSTYVGGSLGDAGSAIVVDSDGYVYMTGITGSTDFPVEPDPGAFQTTYAGEWQDAFVTKLNATGSALVYSTYLGGTSYDSGTGIAVDSDGYAYVTGQTWSSDFPVFPDPGAYQTIFGGRTDAFVIKLNTTGTALEYSTFLGGISSETSYGIAIDSLGYAYVTGYTNSTNFPVKPNPGVFQTIFGGQVDAFVTKLNTTGTALEYSTYLGGSSSDICYDIAVDSLGYAYVAGATNSTNFPVEPNPGAFQTTISGGYDAFVTTLNTTGTALEYSTFLGGSSNDLGTGIAIDSLGYAYVAGYTNSTNFPVEPNPGAFQTSHAGGWDDAFVTKLNTTGSELEYSTYLGGTGSDRPPYWGKAIVVDSLNNAYVIGTTFSIDFPVEPNPGAFQISHGGGERDAFVTKLNTIGTELEYSTYLGGNSSDEGIGIAVDSLGGVYVTGQTWSTNFPVTPGAFQTAFNGVGIAFVTKICRPADLDCDGILNAADNCPDDFNPSQLDSGAPDGSGPNGIGDACDTSLLTTAPDVNDSPLLGGSCTSAEFTIPPQDPILYSSEITMDADPSGPTTFAPEVGFTNVSFPIRVDPPGSSFSALALMCITFIDPTFTGICDFDFNGADDYLIGKADAGSGGLYIDIQPQFPPPASSCTELPATDCILEDSTNVGTFNFIKVCGLVDSLSHFIVGREEASSSGPQSVVLCHFPPGNPDNWHTIGVSSNAVDAHLDHGDWEGDCTDVIDPLDNALCHVSGSSGKTHTISVNSENINAHLGHGDTFGPCPQE